MREVQFRLAGSRSGGPISKATSRMLKKKIIEGHDIPYEKRDRDGR